MSRYVVIDLHDSITPTLHRHDDSATDRDVLVHTVKTIGAHKVKRITICQTGVVFENTTTMEIAIKTAERLLT